MSVEFLPCKMIPYSEVRSLSISGIEVKEAEDPPHPLEEACVLTDGTNYLWAFAAQDGGTAFTRYGMNDESGILDALSVHFNTAFVSEYDDEFQELVDTKYRSDFITIPFPTDDNPGLWKKIWPPAK